MKLAYENVSHVDNSTELLLNLKTARFIYCSKELQREEEEKKDFY